MNTELFESLRMELRRGALALAVMAALRTEQYGYTLRKALADHEMIIDEGTLYPLLARLEAAGWATSQWEDVDPREAGRPRRRLYRLTGVGQRRAREALSGLQLGTGTPAWAT